MISASAAHVSLGEVSDVALKAALVLEVLVLNEQFPDY